MFFYHHKKNSLLHFPIITLFRSTTIFCGIDIILCNILHIQSEYGNIMYNIVSPQEIVMDLNNEYDILNPIYKK